ncbi:MAG: AraC family transcriptional regulator ligand-binding domain-containing protein [Pseudomonadota bacterium]
MASTTAAFALSRGMSMREVERVCGVSGLAIVDPNARLPEDVLPRLWRAIDAREPGEALCIQMASAAPLTYFGGLAHGIQFADTVRTAMRFMIRSRVLLADRLSMALEEKPEAARVIVAHPADDMDRGLTAQCGAAIAARLLTEVLGVAEGLSAVEFAHPAYGPRRVYEEHFAAPVTFEAQHSALVLRPNCLDAEVSRANLELFAYVEQHFAQVIRRIEGPTAITALAPLRQAIAQSASLSDFNAESIAARGGLSVRAAQRLANTNGTTLKALIEEVRLDTARELLRNPRITIEAVADLVGYSDARAFRRAFKRWTGETPTAYRQANAHLGP